MKLISRSDVEAHLDMTGCIALMRSAMIALSTGETTALPRHFMPIPGTSGKMAMMPGTMASPSCFGIKLVCKYVRPADDPLGTHVGMVMLFDSELGIPLALVEGSALTGIRTAAASGLATDLLARDNATNLAMIGTGEQAERHIEAMCAVRQIGRVAIWGRSTGKARDLANRAAERHGIIAEVAPTAADAVSDADIICTTTSADAPVLFGTDLREGQHLNLVGSAIPATAEIDDEAVARGRFFVDSREAAMAAAGELLGAIGRGAVGPDHVLGEIGEVAAGLVNGRRSDRDITLYKSLGVSAQDLAAAHFLWRRSDLADFGQEFDLLG